jgi:CheY-like chemotaxis protein
VKSQTLNEINSEWLEQRREGAAGPAVLIADDSESDIFMLLRAFSAAGVKNPIHVVRGGKEAIDFLAGNGKFSDRVRYPLPRVVFLDLKMPHPDGMDVLRWKQQQIFPTILWIATSNFDGVRTINEAYSAGATTFLTKPLDAADVRNLLDAFEEYWVLAGTERLEVVSDFAGLKASVSDKAFRSGAQ